MGNETSTMNNNQSNNKMMSDLQKQILENQLEIQRIQLNNLQNGQHNQHNQQNQSPLTAILSNPALQQQIAKDPEKKEQLLTKLLTDYNHTLSPQQRSKIQYMLQETQRQLQQQTSLPFMATNIGTQNQNRTKQEIAQSRRQQSNDLQSLNHNYRSEEDEDEARFRMEEERRRQQFREKQRQRRFEYEAKLKQLEKDNVNALRLFQLNEQFTMDELKRSYKKVALRTHPDRQGGSKEKFQVVTKCYFSLLENYKRRQQDKTFDRLRGESRDYYSEQAKISKQYQKSNGGTSKGLFNPNDKQFNGKLFNKVFEDNKLYDPNDEGYDDWLKGADDTPQPQVFSNKFNIDVFNNTFDGYKDTNASTEIVEFKEPQAMVSCNRMGFTEIDQNGKKNFTKAPEAQNELGYSDLKSAYTKTNNLVNPNTVKVKQYRNIDEYEHERSNISFQMTPEQLREAALQKQHEEEEERQRQMRIQQRDYMTENHYNSIHQRMIGN